MKKFRRVLFLVVCLAAMMALSAVTASAAESETQTAASVAKVGDTYYDTLEEAFASIETEGTVELVADAPLNKTINISAGKTVTLNLGNFKVTASKGIYNSGTLTIKGDQGGIIDASEAFGVTPVKSRQNDNAQLNIQSGKIVALWRAVEVESGTVNISGGEIEAVANVPAETRALKLSKGASGTISGDAKINSAYYAVEVSGAKLTISDSAYINGLFGVVLTNNPAYNEATATHSKLTMTGGTIEASKGFALSGNNTQSAMCEAEITGGSLKNTTGETCIYWPMEGTLTIGGDAAVEGGTGIEAKMGTINIKDNAKITGTSTLREDEPLSGGSQAEGSAILASAQMYGANEGQYISSSDLKVNIAGGILSSEQGNAVTVYNTEDIDAQDANITVSGGELNAAEGKAGVKVTMKNGNNTVGIEKDGDTTSLNTSKSKTTVKVSSDVAAAAVDQEGKTSYYKDVNDALAANVDNAGTAEDPVNIYVLGDAEIGSEALESENVKLTTVEGVELKVSSNVDGMIVKETNNDDGSKTYELITAEDFNAPEVNVTADPKSAKAHEGEFVLLTAEITDPDGDVKYSYEWYKDGDLLDGQNEASLEVKESGSYMVKVTVRKTQTDGSVLSAEKSSEAVTCSIEAHDYGNGWKYNENNHWQECAVCGNETDAVPHTFGEWTVTAEPTTDKQGSREKYCTICGYTLTETIAATGPAQGEDENNKNDSSAKTGDDFNAAPMIALMGITAAAAAGTALYGRRKNEGR